MRPQEQHTSLHVLARHIALLALAVFASGQALAAPAPAPAAPSPPAKAAPTKPAAAQPALPSSTDFFRALLEKKNASFADACRVMVILKTKNRKPATFEQDLELLRAKGIVPPKWKLRANQPFDRGELCYMLCKTAGIKGGLTMRIFGVSKRYAYDACAFLGLLPEGHQHQYLTGEELIAVVGLAEEKLRSGELEGQ